MKKTVFYAFLLVLICTLLFTFSSCRATPEEPVCPPHADNDGNGVCDACGENMDEGEPPELSGIALSSRSVTYNGEAHSLLISGTLPEGVSVEYVGNGRADVGEYDVTAKFFYNGKEIAGSALTATLTVTRATYDLSDVHLLSLTKTYDGVAVTPTLSGTLPEGVTHTITVKNSLGETVESIVEVGVYTVYATFSSSNPNYFPIDPISSSVTITAPTLGELSLSPRAFTYDGKPHTLAVVGELPAGVRVVYEGGDKIDVGEYEVVAKFFAGESELTEKRLTAALTIVKATYDMSGVSAIDSSAEYNGASHAPSLSGTLPVGVTVNYTYTDKDGKGVGEIVDTGVYRVVASFVYDTANYNEIAPMTFTYTVTKAVYEVGEIYPTSLSKTYDGVAVRPLVSGEMPVGVSVNYTYTDALGNEIPEILTVGEYTVLASFVYDESNYEEISPVSFVYTVTRGAYELSGIVASPVTKAYDGVAVTPTVGTLPDGLTADFVIKNSNGESVTEMLNADTYTVCAVFLGDFDNYYPVDSVTYTVTIQRADLGGIGFSDAVFSYDGEAKSIFVTGAPSWLTVSYDGNGVTDPGTYTVVASFGESLNYLPIAPMSAKLIIKPDNTLPTEGLTFVSYNNGYAVSGINGDASVIVIPETYEGKAVLSVKSFAFQGNENITYVYIPRSVVNIGNRAFSDCTSLSTLEFGNIEVIGQQAFKGTAIKELSLPESLESVGYGAFEGTPLEKITLPFVGGSRHTSNAYLGFIFGGSTYAANAVKVPSTLKTVVLSNGCTEIPARAFYGITSITEAVIGRSVSKIGNGAFQGCSSLRSVYLPESVSAIPADAKPENGPFYGTAADMMIVVESAESIGVWGKYFAYISEAKTALIIYDKTYDDYVMNKESYRDFDYSDATLTAIFVGKYLIEGFGPDVFEYEVECDVNTRLPEVSAITATPGAALTVEPASAANGSVATLTVVSANGEVTRIYRVNFKLTGSFASSAEVVNKNGAKGTVTFVVDDGYTPTASFMKLMMEKYEDLAVTYAVYTKNFLTTSTEYTTDNGLIVEDIDGDGMKEYVLDENGKYTYVRNEEVIAFWEDILSVGRSEVIAHSHTHAFWGVNDEGGAQLTASTKGVISTRIYSSLAEGSATKEVYASTQIINDIFGDTYGGMTYVNAGIPPTGDDVAVTEEVSVYVKAQTVRVLYDTPVTVSDGKVYVNGVTWVDLQSTVGTIPDGTDVVTTADTSEGVIPKGTPIYLASDYITVPVTAPDGNQNIVKGFKSYLDELYRQAYEDGTFIGARTSGQVVYTAEDFTDLENRLYRRAFIIGTSDNEARPTSWKTHIDNAIAADGGWASFCIHAMVEDISDDSQGAHRITWEQAEDLFSYAVGKGDDLWIATQTDAVLYYHEWSTSTVSSSYDAENNAIGVTLTDGERDEVYTMPLTVKVSVPGSWTEATVGGKALVIRTDSDGSAYVYVDVAPETTVSVIGG